MLAVESGAELRIWPLERSPARAFRVGGDDIRWAMPEPSPGKLVDLVLQTADLAKLGHQPQGSPSSVVAEFRLQVSNEVISFRFLQMLDKLFTVCQRRLQIVEILLAVL